MLNEETDIPFKAMEAQLCLWVERCVTSKKRLRGRLGSPSPRTKQSEALVCHLALSCSQLGALLTIGPALLKVGSR